MRSMGRHSVLSVCAAGAFRALRVTPLRVFRVNLVLQYRIPVP